MSKSIITAATPAGRAAPGRRGKRCRLDRIQVVRLRSRPPPHPGHLARIGEGREADLDDVARRAGRLRAGSGWDCRSSARPTVSRMSKWASNVISPTRSSGRPRPCAAGPGHRIVAAEEEGEPCAATQAPTASRIATKPSAGVTPWTGTSPASRTARSSASSGLVLGAEPAQRPPRRRRREVAASRGHRARLHRRAEKRDRRVARPRSGRRSISSSSFALTRRPL